ncbi:hypothetical protein [Paenibacillus dendritiformis]|uniref:hypothetical protein n=1 Tax=Paenibacillus dendritiformis TaxID=130049 RepID=UPI0018CD223C|nr:hypothetical protein [Paenibacillus dendritiformis]
MKKPSATYLAFKPSSALRIINQYLQRSQSLGARNGFLEPDVRFIDATHVIASANKKNGFLRSGKKKSSEFLLI